MSSVSEVTDLIQTQLLIKRF